MTYKLFRYICLFLALSVLGLAGCAHAPVPPERLGDQALVRGKLGSFLLDAYDNATVIIHDIDGRDARKAMGGYLVSPGEHDLYVQLSGPYYEERYALIRMKFERGRVYQLYGIIGFGSPSKIRVFDETDPSHSRFVTEFKFGGK